MPPRQEESNLTRWKCNLGLGGLTELPSTPKIAGSTEDLNLALPGTELLGQHDDPKLRDPGSEGMQGLHSLRAKQTRRKRMEAAWFNSAESPNAVVSLRRL